MWVIALMAAVMAALLSPVLANRAAEERAVSSSQARSIAHGMAVYRTAVINWAHDRPDFEGVVAEAAVTEPIWMKRDPSIHAAVQGRYVAVYVSGERLPIGVLDELLRLSGNSIWVGIAHQPAGTLHAPGLGDTGLKVPDGVPDQSPTWLARRS
jgi:hypothetical protein